MTRRSALFLTLLCLVIAGLVQRPRAQAPEMAQGYLPELTLASRQLLQLAEATPAGKFGWRPAPGVRSISEVYMHITLGNYMLLGQAGVKTGFDMARLGKEPETAVTEKADVIRLLRESLDAVGKAYQTADRRKPVKFFDRDAVADGIFLRILLHDNEHMGQSIAYARMNGIAPPWSQ